MKAITALTIFGLAALAYAVDVDQSEELSTTPKAVVPKCPPPQEGELAVLIPNPEECTSYYVCDGAIPVKMLCPVGLHFNDAQKACDWPQNACCDPTWDPQNKCPKA